MSSLDVAAMTPASKSQLGLSLAAFLLHDAKMPTNADNMSKVLKAANVQCDECWTRTFVGALEASPVEKFLQVGGGSDAGSAPAGAAKDAKAPAKDEGKAAAKKAPEPEPEPEVDMDMGDLFG